MFARRETTYAPVSPETVKDTSLLEVLDLGRVAVAKPAEVSHGGDVVHKVETPQQRAFGRYEHLQNVFEGRESIFRVYFVLEVEDHAEMHRHLLAFLGLPEATAEDLSINPQPTAVLSRNGITLVRSSNLYENGQAFDVRYETLTDEELQTINLVDPIAAQA